MKFPQYYIEITNDLTWHLILLLSTILVIMIASDTAIAASSTTASGNDVVGEALCRLVANLSGGIARGIATIAIFAVGVGLFLGKLNWGIAAATAAGVAIIFSAPRLVAFLSGDADTSTCSTGS